MKRLLPTVLLLFVLQSSVTACSAAQRAEVASVADRIAPALRRALDYLAAILGMVPQTPEIATIRALTGAASAAVGVYEHTRSAADGCRAWVALYGTLAQSVVTMDALQDVPDTARRTAKQTAVILLGAMPPSCREAELVLGPAETPGTQDAGALAD